MTILKVIGIAVAAFIAFVIWRITSVGRGMRARDKRVAQELNTLKERLEQKAEIDRNEVLDLARKPQLRFMLYSLLKSFNRLDLFPSEFLGEEAQGAAKLAYWMMHPNELQDAPKEIELVEKVTRGVDGEDCSFFVYRYRMQEGHWAGSDWILGLSGPFGRNDPPYEGRAGAFSRCNDKHGAIPPGELVDWFIGIAKGNS